MYPNGWANTSSSAEIGGGGMGVVYEAEHESLKNRVALKVVHPRFRADPKYVRRFHAEARVAAGLHHTNIVSVFDYGDHDGVCFYAMQYIQGQPLDHVLADIRRIRDESTDAQGHVGVEAILTVPAATAPARPSAALEGLLTGRFAAAGIAIPNRRKRPSRFDRMNMKIRRDSGRSVKLPEPTCPSTAEGSTLGSSLLSALTELRYFREIARVGVAGGRCPGIRASPRRLAPRHQAVKPLARRTGNIWVTDFGLAKLEEEGDLSQSRELVGTLRYMAPERLRGKSDRRGDIYSLGATLYELLAFAPAIRRTRTRSA